MRIIGLAVATGLIATPAAAQAQVVPIDPGPIGKGRPIIGTGQNLPSLDAADPYDAGPGFAPQLRRIYSDGTIRDLQKQVAQQARRTVLAWQRHHPDVRRPTVVFDVDDTMLNNYEQYAGNEPAFSYNPQTDEQFVVQCDATANAPVRRLYRRLDEAGFRIAIITGRPASQRAATKTCLRERGYPQWDSLTTRTASTASMSSARFKAKVRKRLQNRGATIVASVGDQISDMSYGRLRFGFLMPNPMYFLP